MLENRVAIGHAGDVVSNRASASGSAMCGFRLDRRVAVFYRHETYVLEKSLE
jgi:hypothetical protein